MRRISSLVLFVLASPFIVIGVVVAIASAGIAVGRDLLGTLAERLDGDK